jgi:CMP/dCMP kinase
VTTRIVAIDGPAGSGKSTLAKALAARTHLPYVNTGSMYRALTAAALHEGVSVNDPRGLIEVFTRLSFRIDDSGSTLIVEGPFDPGSLEAPEVEASVSAASAHPEVRISMRDEQRRLGSAGAVMEGRDIGSVVFPDAPVKIFLEAEPAVREERRALDRESSGTHVARALRDRDSQDAEVNPFLPVEGAIVIDTTHTGPEEALRIALEVVKERLG